jgi:DNA polymerase-3 subunit epsilon
VSLLVATDPGAGPPVQRSFDDLGTPLHQVTFCVIDFETTGGSPSDCAITEVGAVKLQGGECLGTYQTLVNPGQAIPPEITVLTGITQAMVLPAPRIEAVLPSLVDFIGDAVVVGHNVRFDLAFLRAALERDGRPPPANRSVDTVALARRLVRDEVPNCRLSTLASRFRLDHQPSHRALDDALATGDLLHLLLERAGRLGVTGLDDLLALPKIGQHEQAAKLRLTERLPRSPGVYLFRGHRDEVLYVGKATNLRSRVRSYFSGDQRRKIVQLLRETQRIEHQTAPTVLHAAVREVRLIHEHQPRYNRQAKVWQKYVYLKLTTNEPFPRLSVARVVRDDGGFYLGPIASTATAKRVAEAIETTVPLRRCTSRPGATVRSGPCAPAQLGVATCPCAGQITVEDYAVHVRRVLVGLTERPALLLDPLRDRMEALAVEERFEEAADVRDRAVALATTLVRTRRMDQLRAAGLLELRTRDGVTVRLHSGVLDESGLGEEDSLFAAQPSVAESDPGAGPVPRHLADELDCVARFLDQHGATLRLLRCTGGWASPAAPLDDFRPRQPGRRVKRGQ